MIDIGITSIIVLMIGAALGVALGVLIAPEPDVTATAAYRTLLAESERQRIWHDIYREKHGELALELNRLNHAHREEVARLTGGTRLALRPAVLRFAEEMEFTLRQHDASRGETGWQQANPVYLYARLVEEVAELKVALERPRIDPAELTAEASDVANLAMMLADVTGGLADGEDVL